MRRSGSRQAYDDDRSTNLEVVNLRMALEKVVDAETCTRVCDAIVEVEGASKARSVRVVIDFGQPKH